ncbi:hypothetical protein EV421DRAFT_2035569 [Armillaria borealis]|uniref:Uncharacterized protein n=1 Tax=Armillaria borealis TaxID=47425 RepID=A0AA39JJY9_9AGAR|nr:hypothetical protein EV421DRAFT_2035569 [Armillaria borealis]
MATTADEATLTATLLPPVDSTATKKKKKSKKKSIAKTTATDSIPQQQLDATATIGSDAAPTPLFTFSQAVKELNNAQEAGQDPKEALTRFWRHAYRLGEEDGRFEASREMEQAGYQQGYDAAISKLITAGHRLEGECSAGRRARVDAGISASMQEGGMEAADNAFQRGKEVGLDEGRKAGYCDGLDEGRLEAEKGALELFFEGCSAGRKDGTAKEKESWITAGHAESGVCRAGRKDFVDVAIAVGAPTLCFADAGIITDSQIHSGPTRACRRDLVDVAIAVGAPTRRFTDAAVTTDLPVHLGPVSSPKSAPFSWADDVESIPIHFVQSTCSSPGPRDISCLSSGAQKPFASLQHRLKRNSIRQRRSTGHNRSRYQVPVQQHFTRQSSRSSAPLRRVNTFTTQASSLDWTGDPRLFRLRDALEDLGWFRR